MNAVKQLFVMILLMFGCIHSASDNTNGRNLKVIEKGSILIEGTHLEYVVEGKGTPCLVIGSSIYYPRTFSGELRNRLKMYFVDMKWFARDYLPENPDAVTILSIAEDVEQIRKALGLQKPVLLGHSIHGTIAMEYVKRYPGHVSALVLIGSPSMWGNPEFDKRSAELWETASRERKDLQQKNWGKVNELDRLTGKEEAATAYHIASPQYWYDPNYDARWLWEDMTVHSEVTKHLFTRVFYNYNMFEPPSPVAVPVFVALGKYDYVIPYTLWNSAYESVPDFTLVLFEKSGHTPQLEEHDLFDGKLLEWLESKPIKE